MDLKTFKLNSLKIYIILIPALLIFSLCFVFPLIISGWYSLFEWNGGPSKIFIGFRNYKELIKDEIFWLSFKNNILFVLYSVIGQIGIAFLITTLFLSRHVKFKEFHRTVIFFPVILSPVVISFLWLMVYNNDSGLLNMMLKTIGLQGLIRPWLDDPKIVIYSLAIPKIWQYIGYYVVIFMAGAQNIPKEIFEVAEIDGATGFQKTVYVTMPLMWDTIKVSIMLCVAGNMKTFDQIYVMTGGGPGNSSMVLALYSYNTSLMKMQMGYGNAIAVGALILSLLMIYLSRFLMGRAKKW